ncbi:MAG: bifunctional pantoate--beta-alanine ligase/(d)CMP kinase, partial [Oscillatoriales cyanobacterium SM2_1_8]|nr:bifunctional pantoate--beta-alanine ligase/(d)CMP kinase [Oscillatoriales cyanobacterium SM2_1_8]
MNPLQFAPTNDWERYPRNLTADLELCERCGIDAVFAPTALPVTSQVHPDPRLLQTLCAPHRPGHFVGVATIVLKLWQLVQPQRVYFGQKDGQQVAILRHLVRDLSLPLSLQICPTVREADGLACSSRNAYLTPAQRAIAPQVYGALQRAATEFAQGERDAAALGAVARAAAPDLTWQYLECVHPLTLQPLATVESVAMVAGAAYLGDTRLIDNILLRARQPLIAMDGPAGAGKSTVARRVADRLGLRYFDSGATYRAIAWAALQAGLDLADPGSGAAVGAIAERVNLDQQPAPDLSTRVFVDGQEVTAAIRTPEVSRWVSVVSAVPAVRAVLGAQQQAAGRAGGVVMEGRDIGTAIFPQAELKIFLTASVAERAQRRLRDLQARGETNLDVHAIAAAIRERDERDSTRAIARCGGPRCSA